VESFLTLLVIESAGRGPGSCLHRNPKRTKIGREEGSRRRSPSAQRDGRGSVEGDKGTKQIVKTGEPSKNIVQKGAAKNGVYEGVRRTGERRGGTQNKLMGEKSVEKDPIRMFVPGVEAVPGNEKRGYSGVNLNSVEGEGLVVARAPAPKKAGGKRGMAAGGAGVHLPRWASSDRRSGRRGRKSGMAREREYGVWEKGGIEKRNLVWKRPFAEAGTEKKGNGVLNAERPNRGEKGTSGSD